MFVTLYRLLSGLQACTTGTSWTYSDWLFTTQPGVFGLVGGLANPTGVALIAILTLMVFCSLSFVRRGGYFQIFYFSHLNYWLYWGLLVLHAPTFWQWIVFFAIIFLAEKLYRMVSWLMGHGMTVIEEGTSLPSRVTYLKIKKPSKFNYSPGDWCFIKIPTIAIHEWHPFTISSAPEVSGQFTLHIRGVGQWTNSLYRLFEKEYERQKLGEQREVTAFDRIQGTVRKKYQSMRTIVKDTMVGGAIDEDSQDFMSKLQAKTLEERSRERMNKRQEKLRRLSSDDCQAVRRTLSKGRYLSMKAPKIIKYDSQESLSSAKSDSTELSADSGFQVVVHDNSKSTLKQIGQQTRLERPLEIYIDGPFGSPSSNIYRAEHAVLIGTGIGITPFASILQSIMHRYWEIKQSCPNCGYRWSNDIEASMFKLKKV